MQCTYAEETAMQIHAHLHPERKAESLQVADDGILNISDARAVFISSVIELIEYVNCQDLYFAPSNLYQCLLFSKMFMPAMIVAGASIFRRSNFFYTRWPDGWVFTVSID